MSRASTPTPPKLVLGIDPGTTRMGFGVVALEKNFSLVDYGIVSTSPQLDVAYRLRDIHEKLAALIKTYRPVAIGVEDLFFTKNQKTAIDVAAARGIALLASAQSNTPTFTFTPPQVKQAVTGWGQADKRQVQHMVKTLLKLSEVPKPDDAADALAVALCCAQSLGVLSFHPDIKGGS